MKRLVCVWVVLCAFGPLQSEAADKYVNCATGDDTKNGTSLANAWKTISKAAMSALSGDLVHIAGGPGPVGAVTFSSNLTGPGPNCRSSDAQCTIFRGEQPGPVVVTPTSDNVDGFQIQGGVSHLKIENFTFQLSGSNNFNDTVKLGGGIPRDIVLKNVVVDGAHMLGMRIAGCSDVLVDGGRVQGATGNGYLISGTVAEPTSNVTFRGAQALQCGQDGFVVPSASNKVSSITFDRTVANGNGTAGNNDGYDIQAAVAPAPTPVAPPIARFLDAEATSNSQVGIKFTMSSQLENVYVANNLGSGIAFGPATSPAGVVGEVTLLNSTIKSNGSPQIQATGPSNNLGFNLSVNNTIVTGSGAIMMSYSKRYTGSGTPPVGPGGQIKWTRDVVARTDGGTRIRYQDRGGTQHDCTGMQNLALCDAVGDCNFDFAVTVDEILIMVQIGQGLQPVSNCYQGDVNGDHTVTIEEITAATNAAQQNDVHDATQTTAPTFQADGRHLASGSTGLNHGLPPTSFTPVPVCRAGCCDADSHPRPSPSPGGAYDIGGYEGPGTQATSSSCLNVLPGQCVSCAGMAAAALSPSLVTLEAGSVPACSGALVEVPVVMSGSQGSAEGVQFDILFDPATLSVPNPTAACKPALPGYQGKAYTNLVSKGQLRVMIFDVDGDALEDGAIASCDFETSNDAEKPQPLKLDKYIVAGRAGTILEATATNGQLALSGSCSK